MADKYGNPDANPDPLTGTPGAHPVGVGTGALGGAAAGAGIGTVVGGPVGALVGGAVGAVAGGLADAYGLQSTFYLSCSLVGAAAVVMALTKLPRRDRKT